jgi:hypothetical protein
MPNWVYNRISITGPEDDRIAFLEHIEDTPKLAGNEPSPFSFHSFVTPDLTKEEYLGTPVEGSSFGETKGGVWYDWNNAHWNTKWDACNAEVSVDPTSVYISFETAWSHPLPVIEAMSAKYPALEFDVWWEEEQQYGAEYTMKANILTSMEEWDSPSSHADYVKRDDEDGCWCANSSDPDDWFDDCPGKTKSVYVVEVVTKYYVQARTEVDALEAAKAAESGYDLPEAAEIKDVEYAEEYRNAGTKEEDESEVRVVSNQPA